jgi:hypothetical protein
MRLTTIILLLLLSFQVCDAQTTPEKNETTWKVFNVDIYTISYPSTWTIDTSKRMGIDLFIFAQQDTTGDKFRENVNVLHSNVEGLGVTLDTFCKGFFKTNCSNGFRLQDPGIQSI